jgi:hypothetical protein
MQIRATNFAQARVRDSKATQIFPITPSKDPFLPQRNAAMRLTLPQVRFNSRTIDIVRLETA